MSVQIVFPKQSLECALVDDGAQGCVPSSVPLTVTAPMMENAATTDVGMNALWPVPRGREVLPDILMLRLQ
ncbi:unnamed protein product [Coregonus sp. 'balchen']|nr:unnamed protein product [Coregonus sp. 'balchen']